MAFNWKAIALGTGGAVVVAGLLLWLVFGSGGTAEPAADPSFGIGDSRVVTVEEDVLQSGTNGGAAVPITQKVFKIADGPVAGATFVQTQNPTTTIARYVLAESGRAFDLAVDSPGAVPRVLSNTTIPGVARVVWAGGSALLQYIDQGTLKTLALALPAATTSIAQTSARIQFLPNDLLDVAAAPAGENVAYLLRASTGAADGYVASADGSGARKLFSLPLSQALLAWPAPGTLVAQTPPAFGVNGMAFLINAQSGAVEPLLQAAGLTVAGNTTLSRYLYHTAGGPAGRATYARDSASGLSAALSFDPLPEQCIWSALEPSSAYCATAAAYTPDNYGDLRRMGTAVVPQQIVKYDPQGMSAVVAVPGQDGGAASDIADMALSLDERYLLFVKKGDRSLWGVRLAQ